MDPYGKLQNFLEKVTEKNEKKGVIIDYKTEYMIVSKWDSQICEFQNDDIGNKQVHVA